MFKTNAYTSINLGKKTGEFSDHHSCRLGQWYDTEGKKIFGHTQSYKDLDAPHAIVHNNANTNLKYLETNADIQTINNAETILDNFETMENASNEMFVLLDSMLNESKN